MNLENYTTAQLENEILRRRQEELDKKFTTLPEKTVDYIICESIDYDPCYKYYTVYVADGAEGCSYLVKANWSTTESEIIDCIKHDYISIAIKEEWDDNLYIEDIEIDEIPYLTDFMEIDKYFCFFKKFLYI